MSFVNVQQGVDEFKFLRVRRAHAQELQELFSRCYPHSHTTEAGVRWKFFPTQTPELTRGLQRVQLGAWTSTGTLVSQYSNLPMPLRFGDSKMKSFLCADMATDPEYRGRGLISHLAKKVYPVVAAQHAECSFGFSNAAGVQVDKHSAGYGYHVVGAFVTLYKAVVPGVLPGITSGLSFLAQRSQSPKPSITTVENEAILEGEFFSAPQSVCAIAKSAEYVRWRYLRAPAHHNYEVVHLQCADFTAVAVIRSGRKGLEILDVLLPDFSPAHFERILSALSDLARERKKLFCVYTALQDSLLFTTLSRQGFFRIPGKNPSYYLTVKFHPAAGDNIRATLLKPENWWLCGGDIF